MNVVWYDRSGQKSLACGGMDHGKAGTSHKLGLRPAGYDVKLRSVILETSRAKGSGKYLKSTRKLRYLSRIYVI